MALDVHLIPYGSDNYGVLLTDPESGAAACVDAGDGTAVLDAVAAHGGRLDELWITHHHWDHVDGLDAVKSATGCVVYGPGTTGSIIRGVDRPLKDGDTFHFAGRRVQVLHTPGHTLDMINFYLPDEALVFTGDTLFVMGCGRVFEGDGPMMWASLQKLAALPPETRVYCAHEYTQANAAFALRVDPDNPALQARAAEVAEMRARGLPTVPSTIGQELETNPFLRVGDPRLRAAVGMPDATDAEVFTAIRKMKDAG